MNAFGIFWNLLESFGSMMTYDDLWWPVMTCDDLYMLHDDYDDYDDYDAIHIKTKTKKLNKKKVHMP